MKTKLKKVLTRVTAAVVICMTLLATPVFTTTGQASNYSLDTESDNSLIDIDNLKKTHCYYSQDYYNAAVRQMITTVLAPTVAFLKKNEDKFGYHYKNDEDLLKDAALAYALVSVKDQPYTKSSPSGRIFVCHNFSATLKYITNNLWLESSPVAQVDQEGNNVDHEWNSIKIDGHWYDVEPQSGIIYIDEETKRDQVYTHYNNPIYSNRAALLNYYVTQGYYHGGDHIHSSYFRLDPLLVLQAQHPELFSNRGITREMLVDNNEIIMWEKAWEGYKYRNIYTMGVLPYRIEKLFW